MGMPAGGGSAWAHHADGFELLDERGQLWARATRSVTGRDLDVSFPYIDTPYSAFTLFRIWLDGERVTWNAYVPMHRQLTWTNSVAAGDLVGTREIHAQSHRPSASLEVIHAFIDEEFGALTVLDTTRTPRIRVRLGAADPAWPSDPGVAVHGALTTRDRAGTEHVLASYCLIPADRLRVVQLSQP